MSVTLARHHVFATAVFRTVLDHQYSAVALDDVTLDIPANKMIGLIGPDGVGKSTLLGIIAGVVCFWGATGLKHIARMGLAHPQFGRVAQDRLPVEIVEHLPRVVRVHVLHAVEQGYTDAVPVRDYFVKLCIGAFTHPDEIPPFAQFILKICEQTGVLNRDSGLRGNGR